MVGNYGRAVYRVPPKSRYRTCPRAGTAVAPPSCPGGHCHDAHREDASGTAGFLGWLHVGRISRRGPERRHGRTAALDDGHVAPPTHVAPAQASLETLSPA